MKLRNAFSMLELIFVIVIMGIIGKFGTEFLAESYKSFIFSKVNNTLQSNSATAVEFIASRLQYRIRDSIIARDSDNNYVALSDVDSDTNYPVLEWVQVGIDSFRGTTKPYWSGIIDLDEGNATTLVSPETNTSAIDDMIDKLSYGDSGINDAALYFIGSNSDINGYGWDGNAIDTQDKVMHPVKSDDNNITYFIPRKGSNQETNTLSGIDVYEYYKLSWSANAIVMEDYNDTAKMGTLKFYYDYQPWNGQNYKDNGKSATIMENVSTFRAIALGSVIKIQVCTKSNLVEEYALCKEKTIF